MKRTRGYAESRILDGLQLLDCRGGDVGEPDWGSVGEEGLNKGFESHKESFLLLSPAGTGKGFEDVEARTGSLTNCCSVWREGEVGIKGDPQDLRGPTEWKVRPLPADMRVGLRLVGVGGEEGGVGFGDGNRQPLPTGPRRHIGRV